MRTSDPPTRRNRTLKSSSTNSKDSRAMTVADKEGIVETPLFNGLPLVLPGGAEHNWTRSLDDKQ